jgi:hypothetical protein
MKIKPGTVLMAVPTVGAATGECLVCTGPAGLPGREREMAKDAYIVGMAAGLHALQTPRHVLCIQHETRFREVLTMMGVTDADTLAKLGIEFKVATGEEET